MIVVVADDFSGATEIAGAAHAAGCSAEVQTEQVRPTDADVLVVDADSRAFDADSAARRVRQLTAAALAASTAAPVAWFKKTDSVLRGHVRDELLAMLEATGLADALLASANPSRGRVVRDGLYLVDGVPLDQTEFARDPGCPARSARVDRLVAPHPRIRTPDAGSLDDLQSLAAAAEPTTLCAGAADFFRAWLPTRRLVVAPPAKPEAAEVSKHSGAEIEAFEGAVLLVCGSQIGWRTRCEQAERLGLPTFRPPWNWTTLARRLAAGQAALVGLGETPLDERAADAAMRELATGAARLLAEQSAALHANRPGEPHPATTLLLEGGATAGAVLRACGLTRFRVVRPLGPGAALLAPLGRNGERSHLRIGVKPGSYAWPEQVWPPSQGEA